ncbi:uncharacterized protein LOC144601877 isoform X1 [Rhinoraja longicauda]
MQSRRSRRAPAERKCISIWDKSEPAVYPHPITDHWVKLKYQTPELSLTMPQSAPPYYSEKCSRFRYDGCLSSVPTSRITDYLIDEFTELKPGAYPASKPRIPVQFANPYQELKLTTLKYWIDSDTCGNLCPIARKRVT